MIAAVLTFAALTGLAVGAVLFIRAWRIPPADDPRMVLYLRDRYPQDGTTPGSAR